MAMMVVAGPAGAGKGDVIDALADPDDVIIDSGRLRQALFPGLAGIVLGDDLEAILALKFIQWVRWAAIRHAGDVNADGFITTSDPRNIDRILSMIGATRDTGHLRIVDPGREVVLARLAKSQPGRDAPCTAAVDRWYGRL